MTTYKYTDSTNQVVHVIDEDGISRMSMLASALPEGVDILPADPAPPVIYTCSPWQIRKALNAQGLRQQVEDAVMQSDNIELKDGWEFATEFRSDDPFVISMGASIGKSEEETRQLIEYAASL